MVEYGWVSRERGNRLEALETFIIFFYFLHIFVGQFVFLYLYLPVTSSTNPTYTAEYKFLFMQLSKTLFTFPDT